MLFSVGHVDERNSHARDASCALVDSLSDGLGVAVAGVINDGDECHEVFLSGEIKIRGL